MVMTPESVEGVLGPTGVGEVGLPAPADEEFERARVAALRAGFDFVDLDVFDVDKSAADSFPEHRARRDHAVPIGWRYGLAIVAVATPEDSFILDDVYLTAGRDVHIVVATREQVDRCIDLVYGPSTTPPRTRSAPLGEPYSLTATQRLTTPGTASPLTNPAGPSELVPTVSVPTSDWLAGGVASSDWLADLPDLRLVAANELEAARLEAEPRRIELPLVEPEIVAAEPEPEPKPKSEPEPEPEPVHTGPGIADADLVLDAPLLERVLVENGKVSEQEMEVALRQQQATGRPLREIVAELGLVTDAELQQAVALVEGLDFVDLNNWMIDPSAAEMLPESLARRYHILGIGYRGDRPVVAMANPSDVFALDDVRTFVGRQVETVICTSAQIEEYLLRIYKRSDEADVAAQKAALNAAAADASPLGELNDLHAVVEDAPIVKFVNLILRQALDERTSDVHLEPSADDLQVRFRIDGVLHHVTSAPKAIQSGVTSRLKIMANLDIAEHRVPQDGRISLNAGKREIDLRVATLPTVHGEKVVLRVLDKSTAPLDLARLGFDPEVLDRYQESYTKPSGTILVTGPTGSGKSTTLYATLNKLNVPERNLITVEDPVEYQLRGVNQVQVNPRAGLTFANALRSILRSDPDVILIGEIRDRETATIAVEAALTGHLVLSSLHTNDAASAPLRLIEMGVEPFLVCSALDCVLAQRLARVLCDNCAEQYEPTPEELKAARWVADNAPPEGEIRFRRAVGCQACGRTGYRGRVAIQEVMTVSEEVERAILARASTEEIKRLAVFEGMRSLERDGLRKAALGITSLEEILRVIV